MKENVTGRRVPWNMVLMETYFKETLTKMEKYRYLYEQIKFGNEAEKHRLYLTEYGTLKKLAKRMKQQAIAKSDEKRKVI